MARPPTTSTIGYGTWMRRATKARNATATRSPRTVATAGMPLRLSSASGGQPALPPVLDAPGRVPDQRHRRVAQAHGLGRPGQDRGSQRLGRAAREARAREPDRVHDVRVGVADLGTPGRLVQAVRHLVEQVEAGGGVLDLDRVEVEVGRPPAHAVDGPLAAGPVGAPEGVRRDGQPALVVDRGDGVRARHPGRDPPLQEQPQDVALPAGDLLADDDGRGVGPVGGQLGPEERALDRVVVGDRDHVQIAQPGRVVDQGTRARPAVAVAGMHMQVGAPDLVWAVGHGTMVPIRRGACPTIRLVNSSAMPHRSGIGRFQMKGLMQDYPLTTQHTLWRLERLFDKKEIVTKRETELHRYGYGDLAQRVYRLANVLTRLGVKQGDRVATLAWNNYRHLELYYAIPCMGAVLHTLNLRLFPDQLEFTIRDAGDTVLFVDRTLLPILNQVAGRIPSVRTIVVLSDGGPLPEHGLGELLDYETLMAAEAADFSWPKLDELSAAAMCYTSGTTGNPKGVVYSHRSQFLHTMCVLQKDALGVGESDVLLPVVPMFHANSWGLPYAAGMSGCKLIFPDRFMGDGPTILDLAESEGATILGGVPTIWINLLGTMRKTGRRLPKVHTVICGGSAIPRSLMQGMDELGLRMLHAWGMTETSPIGSVGLVRSWVPEEEALATRLKQGVPAVGGEIRIADLATGWELRWDGVALGEVRCRGRGRAGSC